MFQKRLLFWIVLILVPVLMIPMVASGYAQPDCEEFPEECEGGGEEPDYCDEFPDYELCDEDDEGESSEEEDDDDDGGSGPPWEGYSDGRISPDPAEYYTIYCHAGTDTIYVVRVVPETETIKEIPLLDAVNLGVGLERDLGDFMTMERSSEDTITIYGSNGNLAPDGGSKSFSLNECVARNGGLPEGGNTSPPADDGDDDEADEESPEEIERRRRREAEERLDFCFASYEFLQDGWLLAGCLNDTLEDYRDVLNGDELVSLILVVFCLNIIVGNGVLPIGVVAFLAWHRRWLRKQKALG